MSKTEDAIAILTEAFAKFYQSEVWKDMIGSGRLPLGGSSTSSNGAPEVELGELSELPLSHISEWRFKCEDRQNVQSLRVTVGCHSRRYFYVFTKEKFIYATTNPARVYATDWEGILFEYGAEGELTRVSIAFGKGERERCIEYQASTSQPWIVQGKEHLDNNSIYSVDDCPETLIGRERVMGTPIQWRVDPALQARRVCVKV